MRCRPTRWVKTNKKGRRLIRKPDKTWSTLPVVVLAPEIQYPLAKPSGTSSTLFINPRTAASGRSGRSRTVLDYSRQQHPTSSEKNPLQTLSLQVATSVVSFLFFCFLSFTSFILFSPSLQPSLQKNSFEKRSEAWKLVNDTSKILTWRRRKKAWKNCNWKIYWM